MRRSAFGRGSDTDSTGCNRWKSNDEKIMSVSWNRDGHTIIMDKKFRERNLTFEDLCKQLNRNPNQILKYGRDIHNKDMIPGIRYITKVDGQYKFYVSVRYGKMHYYMDINTEKIVMPVPECVQYEKEARLAGYEYCTKEEIEQGKKELDSLTTLRRRQYCDYLGHPTMKFDGEKSLRRKIK